MAYRTTLLHDAVELERAGEGCRRVPGGEKKNSSDKRTIELVCLPPAVPLAALEPPLEP